MREDTQRPLVGPEGADVAGFSGDGSAAGSQISAVVPWSTRLCRISAPPSCSASPCTIDKPSPVPLPIPLVVKKGSMARLSVSSSMPEPASDSDRRT